MTGLGTRQAFRIHDDEPDREPGPLFTQDPAEIAADLMIDAALTAPGLRDGVVASGAVVIVVAPSVEWVETVADSWRETVRDGLEPRTCKAKPSERSAAWVEYRASAKSDKHVETDVSIGMSKLLGLTAFAVDPAADLPAVLVSAADHIVVLPRVDAGIVAGVASRLTGARPTLDLPTSALGLLTPNLLRCARRPDQTADDYVRRLAHMTSRPRTAAKGVPNLDQLHGMPEAVSWGKSLAVDLAAYRRGDLDWNDVDRGALLHGPTGTGKTTFARSLAATCNVPLIATSYAEWQSSKTGHLGDVTSALRGDFARARAEAPCILFIDELDTVGSRLSSRHFDDWWVAIINALLEQMDGLSARPGVVVVAATNHPEAIDPAILRAGRLDRAILIGRPDHLALAQILRERLGDDLGGQDLAPAGVAALGGTGADCERWVRGARRQARAGRRAMTAGDLMVEIAGAQTERSPALAMRISIHEAAHAVFTAVHRTGKLVSVSVLAGRALAGNVVSERPAQDAVTPADIRQMLAMTLSGRAAEEALLGSPSSGAGGSPGSDLASATRLAIAAETELGLGGSLLWRGTPCPSELPGFLALNPDIAARAAAALAASYGDACRFVRRHRTVIEQVAAELRQRGAMSGVEVEAIVKRPLRAAPWRWPWLLGIVRSKDSHDGFR